MIGSGEEARTASGDMLDLRLENHPRQLPMIGARRSAPNFLPGGPVAHSDAEQHFAALIDSHSLTRECIASNIADRFDDIKVSAFPSIQGVNISKQDHFGIIILYLHTSEYQPLDLIKSLRRAHPHSIIFLISDLEYHTNPEFIRAAWRLGARGFVSTKTTAWALALSAIRFVQAGGFFAPVDELLARSSSPASTVAAIPASAELTSRETVVLGLLKEGKTNKVIARELELSSNTVKVHVHNILRKMQASNRTEAASRDAPALIAESDAPLVAS